jgi:hypothetical protein
MNNTSAVLVLACCLCFTLGFFVGMKYEESKHKKFQIDLSPIFKLDSTIPNQ